MAHRRVRHRRGFIIVWGYRTLHLSDGRPTVEMTCPGCRRPTTMRGRVTQKWFTAFFVPVYPLEPRERGTRYSQCTSCKGRFAPTIETLARRAGILAGNDHAAAIRLYNDLRDRPDDAATLLRLLAVYEAMAEPAEADASCRAFPAAFAADPRCAEALRRIWAAKTEAARAAT